MGVERIKRANTTGPIMVSGSQWNALLEEINRLGKLAVAPPLLMTDGVNGRTLGVMPTTGGCQPDDEIEPDVLGDNTEGSEAADTTAWEQAEPGEERKALDFWFISRVGYYHAGDKKLYGYKRMASVNTCGQITAVSAETRYEIDAPETC